MSDQVNHSQIPLGQSDFSFADYDRAPRWLRLYLMHHPYDIHFQCMTTRFSHYSPDDAYLFLGKMAKVDKALIGQAAFEMYGPDHPQAIAPKSKGRARG